MTATDRLWEALEKGLLFLTFLLYPFVVYVGLRHFEPRLIYVAVGGLLAVRFLYGARHVNAARLKQFAAPGICVLAVFLTGALYNDETLFFLMPGLISGVLGGFFIHSLYSPPSMIESFARMSISDLTEETRRYCRKVTALWSVFMFLNSAVVVYLTFASSAELWTLYTGGIAYVLMGLLFAVEFGYRVWKFRQYRGYWFDPFLRWLFPPRGNVKPTYIPLHKIIVQGRRENFPVSFGDNRTHTWRTLSRRVSGLSGRMREISVEKTDPADRWIVMHDSAFSFCTGLLAAWQADCVAVVPPGSEEDALERILQEEVDGMVSDKQKVPADADIPILDPASSADERYDFQILDRDRPCLELFTSGSTGSHTSARKILSNIADEIRTLEENWSQRLGDCSIVSTASHQHIYGLLFHVLWPLCAGRSFFETTTVYPGDIVGAIQHSSGNETCLVSTPAHLRRLVKYEDVQSIADNVNAVFSSGGVLSGDTAERLRTVFGHPPLEVFGSTETGGIAWRERDGGNPVWTPFEPVQVRINDTLHVQSPFLHPDVTDEDNWFRSQDRCKQCENGFEFTGRADREVNVADKRVSLEEVEELLTEQKYVEEAKTVPLNRSSFDSERTVIGAAVVLSRAGSELIANEEKKDVNAVLRDALSGTLDPVALPKLWRYVDQLPRDARGKVSESKLTALFDETKQKKNEHDQGA